MNLIEHRVTEVLGEPYSRYGAWWVDVLANSYGRGDKSTVMCTTEDEAKAVKVGYMFDA
jgi:hypothetical protein